ncbi:ABC transporter permease [Peribacillus deserti]|uniref:Metabolite permease n=1 Tax=Peribacillus deserti TaxID=673318 RepID=A0A2N5M0Q8_9BACI|nr:FtsX-like permease family protein [Peribacillus deserti]PLT27941.1 metabolite permease [Peribacillus deserti]
MKWKDQFRFVRQNMKKNKSRVYMTVLATAMGCAFLIVLSSVGFGLHKSIVKDITGERIVNEIEIQGKEQKEDELSQITDKDINYFESIKKVRSVVRRQNLQQQGLFQTGSFQVNTETVVTHIPSEVKAGFELSKGRLPGKKDEILVGYDFAANLAPKDVKETEVYDKNGLVKDEYRYNGKLIGQPVQLLVKQNVDGKEVTKEIKLTIVGIAKKPAKKWMTDRKAFISEEILSEIEDFTGTSRGMINEPSNPNPVELDPRSYDEVKVYSKSLEDVEGISNELKDNHYSTYSVVDELNQINIIFTIVKIGLIFIGTIAILIASIGIYNTMTMAVTERAPDIGIMKAIGANPKTIKKIFLLESSYIGFLGALIGTAAAYGISFAVNAGLPLVVQKAFKEQPPENLMFSYIPVSLPLICMIICYGVTILSGARPARRATQVHVLKAMRREL